MEKVHGTWAIAITCGDLSGRCIDNCDPCGTTKYVLAISPRRENHSKCPADFHTGVTKAWNGYGWQWTCRINRGGNWNWRIILLTILLNPTRRRTPRRLTLTNSTEFSVRIHSFVDRCSIRFCFYSILYCWTCSVQASRIVQILYV